MLLANHSAADLITANLKLGQSEFLASKNQLPKPHGFSYGPGGEDAGQHRTDVRPPR
jgi:hypothetical protein